MSANAIISRSKHLAGFLLCSFSVTLNADPATIQGKYLLVPRVDFADMGPVEIRFNIDTDDGITLITHSYSDAPNDMPLSGVFTPSTGSLEIFEVRLPNGKRFHTVLEMVSPDDNQRFVLTQVSRLKNSDAPLPDSNPDHAALGTQYDAQCANCHGDTGLGAAIAPSLISCANCNSFGSLQNYIRDTMPLGNTGACDDNCAANMAEFILSVLNAPSQAIKSIDGLILMSDTEVLRKASLNLLNRLPTTAEIARVQNDPDSGLSDAIEDMMEEKAFGDRVAEIFNLYLLTNKYLSSNSAEAAIRLLNKDDFPDARWFDPEGKERAENYDGIRNSANNAVAM